MLAIELEEAEEVQMWLMFDLIFGFLVLLNAVFIGLEISENKDPPTTINKWFVFELAFFSLFSGEWVFRILGAKTWTRVRKDPWMYIDFLLLSVTALDLFIMRWISGGGETGNLTVFRAFR